MKKYITIATLLAAGNACANADAVPTSELITNIGNQLTTQKYKQGDSFEISFTLVTLGWGGSNSANIINLGSDFAINTFIRIQSAGGISSAYIGVGTSDPGWHNNDATWDEATKTNSLTFDTFTTTWLTMGPEKKKQANDMTNAKITFSYDGNKNQSSISVVDNDNIKNVVTYKNTPWNAQNINSGYNASTWSNLSVSVIPVPEPSAFGLLAGLGALALVASRRRRK